MKPLNLLEESRRLLWIILGIAIYSVGFVIFILPHQIVIGGMAGFSTLIFFASGERIPVAFTMYGTNLLLLAAGYKYLGRAFALRTIFGATVMSGIIGALEGYFVSHPPIISDAPISMLLGALVLGVGIGIYIGHGGTAGGTDIVAAVMSKISNVSVGRVMMAVDITIVALSFFLPFEGDMEARVQARAESIIFGWVAIFIYSYVADKFIYAGRQTVQFLILSDKWERIANQITHQTGRGCTTWDSRGYWTGTQRTMMMVWCRQADTVKIYDIIHEIDPTAYVIANFVRRVYGNGFDAFRRRK